MTSLDRRGFLATIAAALALPLVPKGSEASVKTPPKIRGARATAIYFDEAQHIEETYVFHDLNIVRDLEEVRRDLEATGMLKHVESVLVSTKDIKKLDMWCMDLLTCFSVDATDRPTTYPKPGASMKFMGLPIRESAMAHEGEIFVVTKEPRGEKFVWTGFQWTKDNETKVFKCVNFAKVRRIRGVDMYNRKIS